MAAVRNPLFKKYLSFSHIKGTSIFKKLLLLYIFIVLIPVVFAGFYTYGRFKGKMFADYSKTSLNATQLVSKNLQFNFDEMESIAEFPSFNNDMLDLITKEYPGSTGENENSMEWQKNEDGKKIDNYLFSMLSVQYSCLEVDVFTFKGKIYHKSKLGSILNDDTQNNYMNSSWFKKAVALNGKRLFMGSHKQMQVKNSEMAFSLAKLIKGINGDPLAVVLVDYDYKVLKKICSLLVAGNDESIYICDENGKIVYDLREVNITKPLNPTLYDEIYNKDRKSFEAKIDGETMLVNAAEEAMSGWKLITVIPSKNITSKLNSIPSLILFITIVVLLLITFIFILLLKTVYSPLKDLAKKMDTASRGNLNVVYKVRTHDEVGQIGESFNTMISSITNLIKQQKLSHKKIKDSEIKALQSQINPHFLYNTLNTIKWMSMNINSDEITNMVEALVGLLKNTIYREGEYITIKDDIENIKNYIYIQNVRYNNRFQLLIKIDDSFNECQLLKMLLQPIVENCIFHGFEDESYDHCMITIQCGVKNNRLEITIEDNGTGMNEAVIKSLLDGTDNRRGKFNGIGFINVDERIKLNFGEEYGLKIESAPGKGTVVTLHLPLIREQEDEFYA